jgi:hypothetical protein
MNHPERCKTIESMIKNLSGTQLEELFKILQKNNCEYTVNNNGIFLNLSWIEPILLDKIELFIKFCNESKKELDKYEQLCKDINDNLECYREEILERELPDEILEKTTIEVAKRIAPKMSSSMKFYLLKKKFSKTIQLSNLKYNELEKEKPILKR